MVPKLVVTDLDGTLLDYETRRVPEGFDAVLDRVLDAGSAFAVASGRPPSSVESLFPRHADRIWIVSDNGAKLTRGGETFFERAMPDGLWRGIAEEASRIPEVDVLLVGGRACYVRERAPDTPSFFRPYYFPLVVAGDVAAAADGDAIRKVLTCRRDGVPSPELEALRAKLSASGGISAVSAERGWIDFMAAGVDKGEAVVTLMKLLGADPGECVCFGDWENDASMLASCGLSFAMEGGHPAALAAAKFVAPPCTEGGVAKVLSRFFGG